MCLFRASCLFYRSERQLIFSSQREDNFMTLLILYVTDSIVPHFFPFNNSSKRNNKKLLLGLFNEEALSGLGYLCFLQQSATNVTVLVKPM